VAVSRVVRSIAAGIGLTLVAAACNFPGGGGNDPASSTASTTAATVEPTTGDNSQPVAGDICDGFDSFSTIDARGAMHPSLIEELGIPTEMMADHTYFQLTPMGADGALAAAHELTADITFCDFDISPAMNDAIQAAVAGADPLQAIKDLVAQIKDGSGEFGLGLVGGGETAAAPDPLMAVRAFVNLSAAAAKAGDADGEAFAWELAQDAFSDYANGVLESSDSLSLLVTTSAQAELLQLEGLSGELFDKVRELTQKDLEEAAAGFSKCSNDKASVQEFIRSLTNARLVNGGTEYDDTFDEWVDTQRRRQRGEAIPECEGGDFTASTPLPAGWNGTITAHLTSCDSIDWTGDLLAVGTLDSGGGQMSMNSAVPLSLTTDDGKAAGTAHSDVVVVLDVHLSAGEASGTGQAALDGAVEFVVNKEEGQDGTATLKIDFQPGTFTMTIEAAGQTFTQNQAATWGTSSFDGPVTNGGQSCS